MTACVNKHTKRVAAVVTASLVGALSLGVAAPAFAAEGVETLAAESDQDQWTAGTFDWNVDKDDYGQYSVTKGEVFALDSVTDVFGNEVNPGDYTVLYFTIDGNEIVGGNTLVDGDDAVNGQPGGMPKRTAKELGLTGFAAVVVKLPATGIDNLGDGTKYSDISGNVHKVEYFNVIDEQKTLEGAYAYEDNGVDTSDTSFMYTGLPLSYGFADAEGNKLTEAVDYEITWIGAAPAATPTAGTYTAQLNGKGSYTGTSAKVTFTVDKLDFTKVKLTTDIYENGVDDPEFNSSKNFKGNLYADGTPINAEAFAFQTYGYTDVSGVYHVLVANDPTGNTSGIFHLKSNITTGDQNVIGGQGTFDLVVVDQLADVTYDDETIAAAFPGGTMTVNLSKGQSFDPDLFATDKGTVVVSATKDGEPVTDFTEPGTYKVHVEVPAPKSCAYGYSDDLTVVVISRKISGPCSAFVAVDGKSVASYNPSYTGEPIVPSVAVKDSKGKTVPADGYTVTYKDADGEAVDSIVEPGQYTIVIEFPGTGVSSIDADLTVDKATVNSAKAAKDVYAYTGEAVSPSFIAYTGDDLSGTAVELTGDGFGATYYKGKLVTNADGEKVWQADTTKPVNASNLKDEGVYFAKVTVASTNEHYTGTVEDVMFQISEYATFSDVAADAWYADAVYNANDLGYMTGIKGTDLFMPLADISRAELSKVFFNMAGQSEEEGVYFPSAFADVDGWAWYAQPVAWASEAGIVTGYDESTFGPMDKASREQVATMLYRYAKNQGKDVSVDDADAALAAYKDGDQVSDWAKTAMAWSVENGIFGVDTDELWANQNIQRAAVASIAVRFQPEALPEA